MRQWLSYYTEKEIYYALASVTLPQNGRFHSHRCYEVVIPSSHHLSPNVYTALGRSNPSIF